jgi:hypothetical protein
MYTEQLEASDQINSTESNSLHFSDGPPATRTAQIQCLAGGLTHASLLAVIRSTPPVSLNHGTTPKQFSQIHPHESRVRIHQGSVAGKSLF